MMQQSCKMWSEILPSPPPPGLPDDADRRGSPMTLGRARVSRLGGPLVTLPVSGNVEKYKQLSGGDTHLSAYAR